MAVTMQKNLTYNHHFWVIVKVLIDVDNFILRHTIRHKIGAERGLKISVVGCKNSSYLTLR